MELYTITDLQLYMSDVARALRKVQICTLQYLANQFRALKAVRCVLQKGHQSHHELRCGQETRVVQMLLWDADASKTYAAFDAPGQCTCGVLYKIAYIVATAGAAVAINAVEMAVSAAWFAAEMT